MEVLEARHTAGPWILSGGLVEQPGDGGLAVAAILDNLTAGNISGKQGPQFGISRANGLLVAASPDAYEILAWLHNWFTRGTAAVHGLTLLDDELTLREAVARYMAKAHPGREGNASISPNAGACDLQPTEVPVAPVQSSSRGIELGGAGREGDAAADVDPKAETRKLTPPPGVARE